MRVEAQTPEVCDPMGLTRGATWCRAGGEDIFYACSGWSRYGHRSLHGRSGVGEAVNKNMGGEDGRGENFFWGAIKDCQIVVTSFWYLLESMIVTKDQASDKAARGKSFNRTRIEEQSNFFQVLSSLKDVLDNY